MKCASEDTTDKLLMVLIEKQVAVVWACAAKRRQPLGEEMYKYEVEGARPIGRPKITWREI